MIRPFSIVDATQRSEEWRKARLGRATGSRAADVAATIKTGEAAARRDYRLELVVERLTGYVQEDGYTSKDMQRGTDIEPAAFARYEALTGRIVRRTGFLSHNDLQIGCSLDGDVQDFAGIVELKCPKSATHWKYFRGGHLPYEHAAQVLHNLYVTGAHWCDFVSFDDRFPVQLQMFRVRVERSEVAALIDAYERKLIAFLNEVDAELQAVATMTNLRQQLAAVVSQ